MSPRCLAQCRAHACAPCPLFRGCASSPPPGTPPLHTSFPPTTPYPCSSYRPWTQASVRTHLPSLGGRGDGHGNRPATTHYNSVSVRVWMVLALGPPPSPPLAT